MTKKDVSILFIKYKFSENTKVVKKPVALFIPFIPTKQNTL